MLRIVGIGAARSLEKSQGLTQGPATDLVDGESFETDGRSGIAEPRPHATGAGDVINHSLELEAIDE